MWRSLFTCGRFAVQSRGMCSAWDSKTNWHVSSQCVEPGVLNDSMFYFIFSDFCLLVTLPLCRLTHQPVVTLVSVDQIGNKLLKVLLVWVSVFVSFRLHSSHQQSNLLQKIFSVCLIFCLSIWFFYLSVWFLHFLQILIEGPDSFRLERCTALAYLLHKS